jgi:RHS repeat-associated protein
VAQRGGAGEFEFDYDEIGVCTGYHCGQELAIGFDSRRSEELGAKLGIAINGRTEVALAFDARERLTSAAFFDGDRHEYHYDNRYTPSERRIIRGGRDHVVERFDYDLAGLPVRREAQDGSAQVWERDDRDRLVSARDENSGIATAEDQRWGYDAFGDRVLTTTSTGTRHHVTYRGHRPLTCAGQVFAYDRRGRLVSRTDSHGGVTRFHWNSLSQLRRVDLPYGETIAYHYDVFGRRVSKERGTEVDRFLWIDNHLVHEQTGNGQERHYLYQPRTFAPLACLTRGERDAWCCNAVTTDWRGAPITVTAPGGRDVWQADVSPWGERRVRRADVAMPLTLPGQYEDNETGLSYNNARYYNPDTATYITPDPIGLAGGDNCYQYVADPLSQIDPLGLNPENVALGKVSKKVVQPDGSQKTEFGVLARFRDDPAGDGSVRAQSFSDFDPVIDNKTGLKDEPKTITNAMRDAKTIHFNLEGLKEDVVREIVANPNPENQTPPLTRWELATVLSDPELRAKTTFYDRPGVVSKQIPCG